MEKERSKSQAAREREIIKKFKMIIDTKFKKCPLNMRVALFKELEKWGQNELGNEESYLFLTALYDADSTLEVQVKIQLDNLLERIENNEKI